VHSSAGSSGEHAALAMNATNLGVTGSPAFPAAAKALDRNSVAISKSIAAVYGKAAGKAFLDGKFQWRAHVGFFVDYTVALASNDKAGQNKAVANLKRYTVEHGKLLGGATGLPPKAVQADLLVHVLELKGQLDAFANKQYAKAAAIYQDAYAHMFMTADLLAGAIAKQKNPPKWLLAASERRAGLPSPGPSAVRVGPAAIVAACHGSRSSLSPSSSRD
jgi:hypothetical protein